MHLANVNYYIPTPSQIDKTILIKNLLDFSRSRDQRPQGSLLHKRKEHGNEVGITGQGAKSLQTQEVFRKVVKDTIVQDDVTVTISNMRTAISNTHVILNFAITPGLILIPSYLRTLTKLIPEFSNVLTVAKNGMTFGKMKNLITTE